MLQLVIVLIGMVLRILRAALTFELLTVGCDSTAILNLTINNSPSSSEDVTACDSFDWNGATYTGEAHYF